MAWTTEIAVDRDLDSDPDTEYTVIESTLECRPVGDPESGRHLEVHLHRYTEGDQGGFRKPPEWEITVYSAPGPDEHNESPEGILKHAEELEAVAADIRAWVAGERAWVDAMNEVTA